TDAAEERILRLRTIESELAHERRVAARVGAVECDLREVRGTEPTLREQAPHHLAYVVAIAMIDDEAFLPRVHEVIALSAPHVDAGAVDPAQAVYRGRHGHGHRVLVPVGHGLLRPARLAAGDGSEWEAEHRNVGAVRGDADHRALRAANLRSGRRHCKRCIS